MYGPQTFNLEFFGMRNTRQHPNHVAEKVWGLARTRKQELSSPKPALIRLLVGNVLGNGTIVRSGASATVERIIHQGDEESNGAGIRKNRDQTRRVLRERPHKIRHDVTDVAHFYIQYDSPCSLDASKERLFDLGSKFFVGQTRTEKFGVHPLACSPRDAKHAKAWTLNIQKIAVVIS